MDEDVRVLDELAQCGLARVGAQVEDDAALAAVHVDEDAAIPGAGPTEM